MTKLIGFVLFSILLPNLVTAEQYLRLKSGSKYLGQVSSVDKKKFIFCDAKVAPIPDDAKLEDTFERCGTVWVMDRADLRLLTISEGAYASHDIGLATDALKTAEKIQDKSAKMTDLQVKTDVDKIESKAGFRLKDYLDKGKAVFWTKQVDRP
jgi:hypothetical protein